MMSNDSQKGQLVLPLLFGNVTLAEFVFIFGAIISSGAAWGASEISNKEDEYDDIGSSIFQEITNYPNRDTYLVVEVTFNDEGKPDAHAYPKEG